MFVFGVYSQICPSPASPPSDESNTTEPLRYVQPSPDRNLAPPLFRPCRYTAVASSSMFDGSGSSMSIQMTGSVSPTR